jgi:hypothetical protein
VIPATFGALLGFLGLVAPGLVYNTIAEKRRSPRDESTFAEVSRVALTSLAFSLIGLAILWLLQRYSLLALPSIELWLMHGGDYAASNIGKVFFGLFAQVVLACGLAAVVAWILTRGSRSRFRNDTIYGSVFRRWAPVKFSNWVHVKLEDGTEFWGYERAHHDHGEAAARAIVLQGKALRKRVPGDSEWQKIGENWECVIIDAARILYMQVIYRNNDGELRGMVTPKHPKGEPRNPGSRLSQTQPSASAPLSEDSALTSQNSPQKVATEFGPGHPPDKCP